MRQTTSRSEPRRRSFPLRHLFAPLLLLGLLPMAGAAQSSVEGPAPRITTHAPPGQLVDIGTHRLHLHCMGWGSPTVVIDAGLGGFSLEWLRVQSALSREFHVCAYDRAGYGWSDPGPQPRTSERIASELHALLEQARIPAPYVLVGHSFGGYNVQYYATHYTREVAGLVLVDSSHPRQSERFPMRLGSTRPGRNSLVLANPIILHQNYPREVAVVAHKLMASRKALETQMHELFSFQESGLQVLQSGPLPDVPVVILSRGKRVLPVRHGQDMEVVWGQLQEDLFRSVNKSRHLVAMEAGHHIHLDQPLVVEDAIRSVVNAVCQDYLMADVHHQVALGEC